MEGLQKCNSIPDWIKGAIVAPEGHIHILTHVIIYEHLGYFELLGTSTLF